MAKRTNKSRTKKSDKESASKKAAGAQKRARGIRSPVAQCGPATGERAEEPSTSSVAAPAPEKNKGGRPTACTPEILEEILDRISEGEYLEDICRDDHMPDKRTIQRHKRRDDKFRRAYACAREDQMEGFEYKAMCVATDGSRDVKIVEGPDGKRETVDHEAIQRSRLIVEQLRWTMSKLAPTIYGERVALDLNDVTPLESVLNAAKARARQFGVAIPEAGDARRETAH